MAGSSSALNALELTSQKSNYIVKLYLWLLSWPTCRRSVSNVLVIMTHDLRSPSWPWP